MSALLITIVKYTLSILSSGLLYRGFVHANSHTMTTKITGVLVVILTISTFVFEAEADSLLSRLFNNNEASRTEQLYWESVERHPSEKDYRDYLEKYPEGKFSSLARKQLQKFHPSQTPLITQQPIQPSGLSVAEQTLQIQRDIEQSRLATQQAQHEIEQAQQLKEKRAEQAKQANLAKIEKAQAEQAKREAEEAMQAITRQESDNTESWQTIDRYQVKGGLVKDTQTGLMWMRCSIGQEWASSTCRGTATKYKWDEALKIPNGFNYSGYSDWRVPTKEELKTLVYCSSDKPSTWNQPLNYGKYGDWGGRCEDNYVKPTILEIFPRTPKTWFWSSSPDTGYGNSSWYVNFSDGFIGNGNIGNSNSNLAVRLVR